MVSKRYEIKEKDQDELGQREDRMDRKQEETAHAKRTSNHVENSNVHANKFASLNEEGEKGENDEEQEE